MSDSVISVSGLGKRYEIGELISLRQTLRRARQHWARPWKILRSDESDTEKFVWALRDVDLEVKRGEVVGVIGGNGAGKSTFLKILSRITAPTVGRAEIRGRIGSLLEVGTGFHPELTGRENIYLNGSILGMKKIEIDRNIDAIIDFSGIERYIDTPVKRYSSGMGTRLAFAVAAHLEPEVMIIDEVLAVGDAHFQKKCLGKMSSIARGGRTVLFVSHNMDSVVSLCDRVMVLYNGAPLGLYEPTEGVQVYLETCSREASSVRLAERPREQAEHRPPMFHDLAIESGGKPTNIIPSGAAADFLVDLRNVADVNRGECNVVISTVHGHRVALFHTYYQSGMYFAGADRMNFRCHVPSLPLTPGSYFVDLVLADGDVILEKIERAGEIEIIFSDLFGTGMLPSYRQGHVALPAQWTIEESSACDASAP